MPNEIRMKSPVELAFVGDAVYELLVREHIARTMDVGAGRLHREAVSYVCADAQCAVLEAITPLLTEEEHDIVRRGKNASKTSVPRNGSPRSYRSATGFEALLGYLYLLGRTDRIHSLFEEAVRIHEDCKQEEHTK